MPSAAIPSKIMSLSHELSELTPGFGGAKCFTFESATSIAEGKSSNSAIWRFNNHSGTHVDVPYHFSNAGKKLTDYPPEFWFFRAPFILDLPAEPDELIGYSRFFENIPQVADLVLFRTGFESRRGETNYWKHNPGFLPEVATWFRGNRPRVRCIGFDFISLTAFQHREVGRVAHREFLCPSVGNPILIIEDMKLAVPAEGLFAVVVSPLNVKDADGAPVNVTAFYQN